MRECEKGKVSGRERGVEFEWEEKEGGRCWREREGENVSWRERERRYYSGGVRRECGW